MNYTLLDVAINPVDEFIYSAQNSKVLPIVLIVASLIAVISLTVFFIKNKDSKNNQNEQE